MARIPQPSARLLTRLSAVAVFVATGLAASGGQPGQDRQAQPPLLWYDRAAAAFEEALPLGNGRTGAMVFGGTASDRFLLNDSTLWTGGPIEPAVNPDAINWLPRVREALFKGDYTAADALTRKIQGKFSQSYAPLGDLYIDAPDIAAGQVTGYRRELDLATAIARTTFSSGGARHTREAFVSYPDKLLIVRLTASDAGRLTVALRFTSQLRHEVTVTANGDLLLSGRAPVHAEPNYRRDIKDPFVYDEGPNPRGTRFAARARILRTDGTVGRGAGTITLEGATTALVAVAIDTSFAGFDRDPVEGPDPVQATSARLDGSAGRTFESLQAAHAADVDALFGRVDLDLGRSPQDGKPTDVRLREYAAGAADPGLEALYFQFGRYLLISGSRPGSPALNLQGIWNPHMRPPWSSNYTVNINTEMNYWPAETTNLAECHQPLLRFIGDLAKTGAVTARHFYGAGGWCAHHNSDIWALSNPVGDFGQGDPRWANWPLAGVWMSQHLWERYAFGGDAAWLRATGYPLMKGAAEFAMDWLVEGPDGFLVTAPSTSPENAYKTPEGYTGVVSIMTTADLALIRGLFLNVIQAADTLGIDADFRASVRAKLGRLPPYKVGSRGHLQEWYRDWDDQDPEHRHVSHLIGLYPGRSDRPDRHTRARGSREAVARTARRWRHGLGEGVEDRAMGTLARRGSRIPHAADAPAVRAGVGRDPDEGRGDLRQPVRRPPAVPDRRQLRRNRGDRGDAAAEPARRGPPAAGAARGVGHGVGARSARPRRAHGDVRWRDANWSRPIIRADRDGTVRVRYGALTAERPVKAGQSLTVTAGAAGLSVR